MLSVPVSDRHMAFPSIQSPELARGGGAATTWPEVAHLVTDTTTQYGCLGLWGSIARTSFHNIADRLPARSQGAGASILST